MVSRLSSGGKGEVGGGAEVGVGGGVGVEPLGVVVVMRSSRGGRGEVVEGVVVGVGVETGVKYSGVVVARGGFDEAGVAGVVGVALSPWCSSQWARAKACRLLFDHGVDFFFALTAAGLGFFVLGSNTGKSLVGELRRTVSNEGSFCLTVTHLVCGCRDRNE